MKSNSMYLGWIVVSLGLGLVQCGMSGRTCVTVAECGDVGEVLCVAGQCQDYQLPSQYGSLLVDLSFQTNMSNVAVSAKIFSFHPSKTDGGSLRCSDFLTQSLEPTDVHLNPLRFDAKYIVLDWSSAGGTLFSDILVQNTLPTESALFYVRGYQRLLAQGKTEAAGCTEGVTVRSATTRALRVEMKPI